MAKARNRAGGLFRYLAIMSTAVLMAVVVVHPGRPPERRRHLAETRLGGRRQGQEGRLGGAWGAGGAGGRTTAEARPGGAGAAVLAAGQAPGREACVTAAVAGPTPVHGWVEKAGPLPMHLLDGPDTKPRHKRYYQWRDFGSEDEKTQEALVNGQPMRVGRPPPLFPYCRILVNHPYRTLYLKAPKTGSTSLLTLLGTCTGNATSDKATCFQPLEVMESQEEYEQLYNNYFAFTVVRNPWARAVSSYRMLSRYLKHGCKDRVGGWNNVCLDVNRLPLVHKQYRLCTINRQAGEGFAVHHLIPQAPCLVTASGEWAADYVVRTENMQEDMREVLKEMNERRQPDAAALDVEALLGQLTNVNGLRVACQGHDKPAAADSGAAANQTAAAGGAAATLSDEIAAVRRRRALEAGAAHVVHLEAPESYCATEMYYEGQHSQCFDSIAAYYQEDVRLLGLPTCREAAA